ncbi:hypothetical protein GCM10009760_20860 [Kitasatospora kazusensis]|uniref:DUF2690 domain-containing protein n=1 Tax=Kitasatospora kazusensis TaxID=407974 RepID=A0ABN2Z9V6_9ACTN
MRTVRTTTAAAALLLAAAALGVLPGPAAAASRCTKAACDGRDPSSAGCAADAVTRASFSGASVRVELRYSPSCQAAWARATAAPPGQTLMVEDSGGARSRMTVHQTPAHTQMVDATTKARACLGPADSDVLTCTPWV